MACLEQQHCIRMPLLRFLTTVYTTIRSYSKWEGSSTALQDEDTILISETRWQESVRWSEDGGGVHPGEGGGFSDVCAVFSDLTSCGLYSNIVLQRLLLDV